MCSLKYKPLVACNVIFEILRLKEAFKKMKFVNISELRH